jgi:hypothetical protein
VTQKKKKKKEKLCKSYKGIFFLEKRPKVVAIFQGPKNNNNLEMKFQLFLGKFSPLPIDTKGGEKNGCANLSKEFFFLKKGPKLLLYFKGQIIIIIEK